MLIEAIEVKNFRCLREARMDCSNLTAIIGRNGAGKSTFLYALDAFYDISANITAEDFFDRDTESTIEIRVTYSDLREDEQKEFKSYIRDDKLIVTKRISWEDGKTSQRYYGASLQIPQFVEIRKLSGKRDRRKEWNTLIDNEALPNLIQKARSADQVEELMDDYERSHPELTQPIERLEQFFGAKAVGGGKLDKYTRFVLVPAVRDACDETSGKKGAVSQLIDMIVLRKVSSRKDIIEFKQEFEEKITKLYSSDNLTELPELGEALSKILDVFAPGAKLLLRWDEVNPPQIQLPSPKATLVEDEFEGEISKKGHGLQRALILTLLQQLAGTSPIEPEENAREGADDENRGAEEASVQSIMTTPDLILAIEEPELYLHPSRSRYLSQLLLDLSIGSHDGQNRNQILYATHSPYFVDLNRFDQIRVMQKISSPDSPTKQSIISRFSLQQASQELAQISDKDTSIFTADTFKARSLPIMNVIVNEGFFADVVVVVEGMTEIGVLWKMQELLDAAWVRKGIVIVPANGKNNIDRPVVIFRGFSIPTYFIFDGDAKYQNKGDDKEKETKRRNQRYLKLAKVPPEDFPPTQVKETWAAFHNDIEQLIEDAVTTSVYHEIRDIVAEELCYDKPSQVVKNIDGAVRLIELVYKRGYRIPELEEIIQQVSQLGI